MDKNTDFDIRIYDKNSADYRKALVLRWDVLNLSKGVGQSDVDFILGDHPDEDGFIKIGAFIDGNIVGTLDLAPMNIPGRLLLRQFAVSKKLQGYGIGMKLIKFAHNAARERGYTSIELHARQDVIGFYQKAGYRMMGRMTTGNITLEYMHTDL